MQSNSAAMNSLKSFATASAKAYAPVSFGTPVASASSTAIGNPSGGTPAATQPAPTSNSSASSTPAPAAPSSTSKSTEAPANPAPPAATTTPSNPTSSSKADTNPKSTEATSVNRTPFETKATSSNQQASASSPASKQPSQQASNSRPAPLKAPTERNIYWGKTEGAQFVALNVNFDKAMPGEYEEASGSKEWKICQEDVDGCIKFIGKDCLEKQVFLVCSGGLGYRVVPAIENMSHVHAIYVHCADVQGHRKWADSCPKVRVVCDFDQEVLLPQLAYDSAHFYFKWACELIEKGDKGKAKANLEKALEILQKHTKGRHEKEWETRIADKLKQCS